MARKASTARLSPARSKQARPSSAAPAASRATARDRKRPVELGRALVDAFRTNERVNQVLLELVDPAIWRRFPPSSPRRNIATSFAHVHNVRCMRLKMSRKDAKPPRRLERGEVTIDQAQRALGESAGAMIALIEESLAAGGHVRDYRPDVVGLVCAAITHEAHHRGQICHWARELGSPISAEDQLRLWEWNERWKEVAGTAPGERR